MSWPQWPAPQPSVPPVLNPSQPVINSAPAVVPPGFQYSPEQWAQLQQQNWHQWAQWQQQYQQWHQQYGAEYQKSMNALAQAAQAQLPNVAVPPPLPVETKPPLPAEEPPPAYTAPPPAYASTEQRPPVHYPKTNWPKRPYEPQVEPEAKKPNWGAPARPEELSEAEKKFDKQFAEWEAQFNKWKEQNANHPDKEQYREYEKKWESWRAQLLERREQMKRKRLGLPVEPIRPKPTQNHFNQTPNFSQPPPTNFSQPPPHIPKPALLPTPFSKPPPNMNDEPLAFKEKKPVLELDENGSEFLKPNTGGGIPGLDLVKDEPKKENDVVVLDVEEEERKGPDFDAISKGINSILGDQKLLNMLSMVSQNQSLKQNDLSNSGSRTKDGAFGEASFAEQSNLSFEEKSNHSEREFVNNFDDQTRSSFTMAHDDTRFEAPSNFKNQFPERFSNFKNNQFGRNDFKEERFGGTDFNQERFGRDRFAFGSNQDRKFATPQKENSLKISNFGNPNKFALNESNRFGAPPRDDFKTPDKFPNRNNRKFNFNNEFYHQRGYEENYDDYDYEGVAANFEVGEENAENWPTKPSAEPFANEAPSSGPEINPIFQPTTVIDYEHKSLKTSEPEILIEPIYMFDYRHKAISRIPIPQRPKWLAEIVKNIREFDPPVVRPYEPRRYMLDNWRGGERYQDNWPPPRRFDERRSYEPPRTTKDWPRWDEKKPIDERKKPIIDYEEEKISDTEWPDDDEQEVLKFAQVEEKNHTKSAVLIEDLISAPGRFKRPPRIVIILRGPPGSGKTFLAKLIKDKEVENGGSAPRILSLDDYFMIEQEKEVTEDGKKVKVKEMIYEYEEEMEESYRLSLIKSFKKTITDGYFSFIIVDNVNDKVKYFGEMWSFAKQNGFQVYICQLDLDVQSCSKRNIHGRSEADIEKCVANWEPTPVHHPILDATSLLQSASIPEVEMEEVNSPESDIPEFDESEDQVARSKWDNFDLSVDNLAKLDGVSKPLRHRTMEEYLQLDSEWTVVKPTRPGQKRVRWADLEEQKQQAKMRAIGFVVGHTNWDRMMDPTGGSSALTQTKYIEKTGRFKVDQK